MSASSIAPLPTATAAINPNANSGSVIAGDGLEAATPRFVEINIKNLKLYQEAALPGRNTRSLLHTALCPVCFKSGKGYQVTSEDGHTYTDLVGELTAGFYGHSHPVMQDALFDPIKYLGLDLGGAVALETRHAAMLCQCFKLNLIRFTISGAQANLHAIQGGKRFTCKNKVVASMGGCHGHFLVISL